MAIETSDSELLQRQLAVERSNGADSVRAWASKLNPAGDPLLSDNPYPAYAKIREHCPVVWNDLFDYWMCTRFDDVFDVMRDAETYSNAQLAVPPLIEPNGPRIPLQSDAPEHQEYRQLLLPLFSPARAAEMADGVREVSKRLLSEIRERGECEFVRDYAIPLPFEVMLTWLGIPREGWPMVMAAEDGGIRLFAAVPDARQRSIALKQGVAEYFTDVITSRREHGGTGYDAISYLIDARFNDRLLSLNEIQRICMLLFSAGLHSTTSQPGNMMVYLSQNPEQRDRLIREPEIISVRRWQSVIAELGRHHSSSNEAHLTAVVELIVETSVIQRWNHRTPNIVGHAVVVSLLQMAISGDWRGGSPLPARRQADCDQRRQGIQRPLRDRECKFPKVALRKSCLLHRSGVEPFPLQTAEV